MPTPPLPTKGDLRWYTFPSDITEITIVRPEFASKFKGELSAIHNQPGRAPGSLYWQLYDLVFGGALEGAIYSLITNFCSAEALTHARFAGLQLAWSPPGSERSVHKDQAEIAFILITFTLQGCATIELYERTSTVTREFFDQTEGGAYILQGEATTEIKHGTATGAAGRWAATARFVEIE